jgi:DNA primase small subunit
MPARIQDTKFLQLKFQEYYRGHMDDVMIPDRVHMREFGIERWEYSWVCIERYNRDPAGGGTRKGCGSSGKSFVPLKACPKCGSDDIQQTRWSRHNGFRTAKALVTELTKSAPHSIYHSAAFYNVPVARSMSEKEWQGAELVFDIDADHMDTACSIDHDAWRCNSCHTVGQGRAPVNGCPNCGEMSFASRKWICEKCLDEAKNNTLRVYDDFLIRDLGIDPKDVELNYSGHRGFHIRVKDPRVFDLESGGRMEIVHFITGTGFTGDRAVVSRGQIDVVPNRTFPGWSGKIADAMITFIRGVDKYEGKERWVQHLRKYKAQAIEGLLREPPILSSKVKGVGIKSWQEIATKAAVAFGGEIDVPVTHDIHRVIRLIGSLNGKTGFTVTPLTRDEMDGFDAFNDAIVFNGGDLKVKVPQRMGRIPDFRIHDESFGPYENEVVELPISAAIFLLCKGVGEIE